MYKNLLQLLQEQLRFHETHTMNKIVVDDIYVSLKISFCQENLISFSLEVDCIYPNIEIVSVILSTDDPDFEQSFITKLVNYRCNISNELDTYIYRLFRQPLPECYVCMEVTNHRLPCEHVICRKCFYKCLNTMESMRCGMCRKYIDYCYQNKHWILAPDQQDEGGGFYFSTNEEIHFVE